jgi:hypothetical protein
MVRCGLKDDRMQHVLLAMKSMAVRVGLLREIVAPVADMIASRRLSATPRPFAIISPCNGAGSCLEDFSPTECAACLRNARYGQPHRKTL